MRPLSYTSIPTNVSPLGLKQSFAFLRGLSLQEKPHRGFAILFKRVTNPSVFKVHR